MRWKAKAVISQELLAQADPESLGLAHGVAEMWSVHDRFTPGPWALDEQGTAP